jgi:hypothetical protein
MTTLTNSQLQEALDKSPSGVRVTPAMMERRIKSVDYFVLPGTTVTICSIALDNGFSVRGESACVDPKNFNQDIGQTIAYDNAFSQLWAFFGFLIAEMKHVALSQDAESDLLHAVGQNDGE